MGENILFIGYKGKKLKKKDIEIIAEEIFTNWKNSPKHYENMINPQFKLCGFGFATGKNKLYATNVFGTKGYVIEGQVSNNAFGIKSYNKICDNFLSENSNLMVNIGNLYCIVVADILDSWDVNKKVFSKILSPDLVKDCISEFSDYEDYDKMLLNYHITASRYYGQNNDYTNLKESFDFIVDYFKNSSLNINDEIKLCLFFNNWSRYDLCIEFLKKRRNDPDFNEEAAFLLAQTSLGYPDVLTEEELSSIAKGAFHINKKRWCNWINREFQHQRNRMVKEIYCNECSTSD